MTVVILFSILALIFSILDSLRVIKNGMLMGFILVTLLGVLHYDYGNDYMPYLYKYEHLLAIDYSWSDIGVDGKAPNNEHGWAILNMLFFPFGKEGFFVLVAAISIFENYAYYHMIKRFIPRQWWWCAVFIYLFSTSTYIVYFSLIRQGLVASAFVLLYLWIAEKKAIRSAVVILLLSTIHTSAIVLLPFAFLGYLPVKWSGAFYAIVICSLFSILWISSTLVSSLFNNLAGVQQIAMYSEKYVVSTSDRSYGLGFMMNMIPFIVLICYLLNNKFNTSTLGLLFLTTMGYILIPMIGSFGDILSRLMYYFVPFSVFTIPITYASIKRKELRLSLLFLQFVFLGYNYLVFFSDPTWESHFSEFHTIFEASL